MNDFTKEELMEIRACVCNIDGDVLAKLQSMIENYCDHYWRNTCCGCNPGNMICEKCNINLEGIYDNQ